ncbi:hypothetical protein LPAF129_17910 [Ligilactobacillus pabuli]|uniref:DUF3899 domain-containing protein n=1 Tax=Ligilactobacillus pabuli TaxID=2886039 RepID=A0ABQ5JMI1_9LACO|nr:DUF3899 domain-containing protein [Ligilactobacillus pabuli]GKS82105.1 hypothetical protein LPAF129_17910 [Ligilactobacillus pabuli]
MENFKKNLLVKFDLYALVITSVLALLGFLFKKQVLFSDGFFMLGLLVICVAIFDILLHASMMSGWFQHKHRGETDDEYQERKINVRDVAQRKNQPIHWDRLAVNGLLLGGWLIICAVLLTL